jgi:pseudouridine-5'-phosphate glycosidase
MLKLEPEIERALATGRAVVALESTLISHGLPADRRLDVARRIESAVREEGATPATIAIVDGVMRIGLDEGLLSRVAFEGAEKASIRDLAVAIARGGVWSTTVAATMAIAHRAGVRVFATGGIGGVHRGAELSFDESADLYALARYPLLVVCAGAKAVLDLPRTMERLETLGVPVVGYRTGELPAFYHAQGGIPLACRIESPQEAARIMRAQIDQLRAGGMLVVQPPPPEFARDPDDVGRLIDAALARAKSEDVQGRAVTPFLLAALDRASSGAVVDTNVALVESNARLAARIALADRTMDGSGA